MKKYDIWYSWHYEDFRRHAGNNNMILEFDHIPNKNEIIDKLINDDNLFLPCSPKNISIDNIEVYNG